MRDRRAKADGCDGEAASEAVEAESKKGGISAGGTTFSDVMIVKKQQGYGKEGKEAYQLLRPRRRFKDAPSIVQL